jgi:Fur family peroxide stress response transcriptional regulator
MDAEETLEARTQAVLAELKRAGLKLTPQRIAIVRELAGDRSHPTAQELFERLRPGHPAMSFATVYNTLDALVRLRLLSALRLGGDQAMRFDANTAAHHHAVCDACGAVVDIPALSTTSDPLRRRVEEVSGFTVRAEERIYRGLCGRCSENKGAQQCPSR